jgi:hypothetical protein
MCRRWLRPRSKAVVNVAIAPPTRGAPINWLFAPARVVLRNAVSVQLVAVPVSVTHVGSVADALITVAWARRWPESQEGRERQARERLIALNPNGHIGPPFPDERPKRLSD